VALKPVTLDQARRWPAAAKRRASFCARMGGMRRKLTGDQAAADPTSPINRALAAWDCDQAEGLKREQVSKGIRMKSITPAMVGSAAKKKAGPKKNPTFSLSGPQVVRMMRENGLTIPQLAKRMGITQARVKKVREDGVTGEAFVRDWVEGITGTDPARGSWAMNPSRKAAPKANPSAMLYTVHTATREGKPRDPIAHFRKRADALTYAQAYAKTYGAPVVLTGKKL
jgi:transcriptional regulator with XRE-family HTH domain